MDTDLYVFLKAGCGTHFNVFKTHALQNDHLDEYENLDQHQVLNPHVSYSPLELLGQMTGTSF